jgi:hypothetical protein
MGEPIIIKMKLRRTILLLIGLLAGMILFAQTDTGYHAQSGVSDVEDTDPGLFLLMMFLVIGFIVSFLIVVFIIACVCLVVAGLTFAGIISTSTLIGLYTRSLKKGIRSFFQIGGAALGIPFGIIIAMFIRYLWLPQYDLLKICLWCILGGCISGLLMGVLSFRILNTLYRKYSKLALTLNE